ncbi:MAG: lactonase family protein, partial [Verrucomicrobiota bacterium]
SHRGTPGGEVVAYAIQADGTLREQNRLPTQGGGPCHVSVDPSGGSLLVANYGGGSCISFPILPTGGLGAAGSFHQHEGSSIHPKRQTAPHAHAILPDPQGHQAFVPDLGMDRILIYELDGGLGSLTPGEALFASAPAGSGPRHIAFHPNEPYAFVNYEMTSEVATYRYDSETGELTPLEVVSTLPSSFEGRNSTAEILVSPDGRQVYVSNRGHHTIAIFSWDSDKEQLVAMGHSSSGGEVPRNFGIHPDGTFLVSANQRSGNVVSYLRREDGSLKDTGQEAKISSPVCVRFHVR